MCVYLLSLLKSPEVSVSPWLQLNTMLIPWSWWQQRLRKELDMCISLHLVAPFLHDSSVLIPLAVSLAATRGQALAGQVHLNVRVSICVIGGLPVCFRCRTVQRVAQCIHPFRLENTQHVCTEQVQSHNGKTSVHLLHTLSLHVYE